MLSADENAFNLTNGTNPSKYLHDDVLRQREWALATGSFYLTYAHVDASGLCTYSYLTTGTKLWSYVMAKHPEVTEDADHETLITELFVRFKDIAETGAEYKIVHEYLPERASCHNVVLREGVLL